MIKTFSPRVSKLEFIPVERESLLNSIIRFEKSSYRIMNRFVLSLKDICTRRLLLSFGDDHEIYRIYLSSQLYRYISYDYFIQTNHIQCQRKIIHDTLSNVDLLCCRDCSINDLGASKCRRRKCLSNRVQCALNQLSCQIIPWEEHQKFAILENNHVDDDDEDENNIVFIYTKSNNSSYKSTKHKKEIQNDRDWIRKQFYLLDLLSVLQINIAQEGYKTPTNNSYTNQPETKHCLINLY